MDRAFFLRTERLGFSVWQADDAALAAQLWGDPAVTRYICASGRFSADEIADRLQTEISRQERFGAQYWPVFELATRAFVGCCGLRPHGEGEYEIGFHLRPEYWGRGYAAEAAEAAIRYAFHTLGAKSLFAGHNPNNAASRRLLLKLGFAYVADEYYAPTGLNHPSYRMIQPE